MNSNKFLPSTPTNQHCQKSILYKDKVYLLFLQNFIFYTGVKTYRHILNV